MSTESYAGAKSNIINSFPNIVSPGIQSESTLWWGINNNLAERTQAENSVIIRGIFVRPFKNYILRHTLFTIFKDSTNKAIKNRKKYKSAKKVHFDWEKQAKQSKS